MLSFETGCNLQCRFIPSENDISATYRQNINAKIYRMHENTFSRIVSSAISLRILHHTPYQSKGVESAQRSSIRPRTDIGWWLIQSNCFIKKKCVECCTSRTSVQRRLTCDILCVLSRTYKIPRRMYDIRSRTIEIVLQSLYLRQFKGRTYEILNIVSTSANSIKLFFGL